MCEWNQSFRDLCVSCVPKPTADEIGVVVGASGVLIRRFKMTEGSSRRYCKEAWARAELLFLLVSWGALDNDAEKLEKTLEIWDLFEHDRLRIKKVMQIRLKYIEEIKALSTKTLVKNALRTV